jgi:adenylate cyclase
MDNRLPRRIRLVTGLVLFAYVISHLANLALGLHSLDLMDRWRPLLIAPWQNPVGTVALYGSLMAHLALGLHVLYRRRTLRMSRFDAVQLVMALALPPLMVLHVLGTRVAFSLTGFEATYSWLMLIYWKWEPVQGLRQVSVIMLAWVHGCMGLYYWMRLQPWWSRVASMLYPLAFLVPVASLLGFVEAGKDALALFDDTAWLGELRARAELLDDATVAGLYRAQTLFVQGYFALLAGVLLARAWRLRRAPRVDVIQVTHVGGPTLRSVPGLSLLEISRLAELPHANVCGGRGRCGTCRVRVLDGIDCLATASKLERATLARLGVGGDIRLACQAVPLDSPLTVERLVGASAGIEAAATNQPVRDAPCDVILVQVGLRAPDDAGVAVNDALFALERHRDTVLDVLNGAGGRTECAGARGARVIFGLNCSPADAARAALSASRNALAEIDALTEDAAVDHGRLPVTVQLVLHAGVVRVGEDGEHTGLAVVGAPVDAVERAAAQLAESEVRLMVTEEFARVAELGEGRLADVELRARAPRVLAVGEDGALALGTDLG